MFHLLSPQPFSDWLSRCRRYAEKHGLPIVGPDWQSPAWHAMHDVGMKPDEACLVYMED